MGMPLESGNLTDARWDKIASRLGEVLLRFTLQLGCDAERAFIPSCKHVPRDAPAWDFRENAWIQREESSRLEFRSNKSDISMRWKRHRVSIGNDRDNSWCVSSCDISVFLSFYFALPFIRILFKLLHVKKRERYWFIKKKFIKDRWDPHLSVTWNICK